MGWSCVLSFCRMRRRGRWTARGRASECQHATYSRVQEDLKARVRTSDNHGDLGELVRIEAIILVPQQRARPTKPPWMVWRSSRASHQVRSWLGGGVVVIVRPSRTS